MKRRATYGAAGLIVLALVALPLPYVLKFDHTHALTAAILVLVLAGITLSSRATGVVATLLFLIVLGDYRRYAGYFQGYPANDPLLLVAPLAAFFMACLGFLGGRTVTGGRLGTLCFAVGLLAMLMTAQIFNPAQGGLEVGIAGALFYFVPLLWYWIGRVYGDARTVDLVLFRALIPLGVAAAALGLYQSLRGLLPFEAAWVEATGYGALYVSAEVVRAIGFFNSGSEYTRFLLIVIVIIVAAWLAGRTWWVLVLPLLLAALFLASSRGPIVLLVLTSVTLWAVMARRVALWPPRFVLAGVIGVSLLTAALIAVRSTHLGERSEVLVSHQVEGLLDPTNPEKSTAVGHLALGAQGILEGFISPAGQGLGATTLAASKFGQGGYSTEMDFANMFYSLGFIGGLLYLGILALALARALRVWRELRTRRELAMLGILIATLTAWMLGGEYSIAALVWFLVGAIDRSHAQLLAEKQRAARNAYRLGHT